MTTREFPQNNVRVKILHICTSQSSFNAINQLWRCGTHPSLGHTLWTRSVLVVKLLKSSVIYYMWDFTVSGLFVQLIKWSVSKMPSALTDALEEWKCTEEEYQRLQVRSKPNLNMLTVLAYSHRAFLTRSLFNSLFAFILARPRL